MLSKVIRLCGGENVFAGLPLIAPEVDREALVRANPEAIISSGASLEGWKSVAGVAAVTNAHLYSSAPEQRHTPRLLEGAQQLCSLLERVRERS